VIKGISGGEKKRTCIGVEIVSNAPVIVLDEPTSGLDSFTAFVIINILKRIAAQ
jgi:ATP-binding cassette subfamily G (WHITE) protein 2